jgi:hypothetical protein
MCCSVGGGGVGGGGGGGARHGGGGGGSFSEMWIACACVARARGGQQPSYSRAVIDGHAGRRGAETMVDIAPPALTAPARSQQLTERCDGWGGMAAELMRCGSRVWKREQGKGKGKEMCVFWTCVCCDADVAS